LHTTGKHCSGDQQRKKKPSNTSHEGQRDHTITQYKSILIELRKEANWFVELGSAAKKLKGRKDEGGGNGEKKRVRKGTLTVSPTTDHI